MVRNTFNSRSLRNGATTGSSGGPGEGRFGSVI
jgi:hypothetical protein